MKDMIQKTIEVLKEKIRANLLEIQNNQKEIRGLLKQTVSEERSAQLEERYALNKALLAENNDFINVQLTLTNFVEKYSNNQFFSGSETSAPANENESFEQVVSGKAKFDESHPYFENEAFFQKLLDYYKNIEDYESCSKLMNYRYNNKV
jgi:hypothetical protein